MKKISNKILYIIAALAAFLLVISAFASERPIGFLMFLPALATTTLLHILSARVLYLGRKMGSFILMTS